MQIHDSEDTKELYDDSILNAKNGTTGWPACFWLASSQIALGASQKHAGMTLRLTPRSLAGTADIWRTSLLGPNIFSRGAHSKH